MRFIPFPQNGWRICGEQFTRLKESNCFRPTQPVVRVRNMRLLYVNDSVHFNLNQPFRINKSRYFHNCINRQNIPKKNSSYFRHCFPIRQIGQHYPRSDYVGEGCVYFFQ